MGSLLEGVLNPCSTDIYVFRDQKGSQKGCDSTVGSYCRVSYCSYSRVTVESGVTFGVTSGGVLDTYRV